MGAPASATKPAPAARPSFMASVLKAMVAILALIFLVLVAWVSWLNYRHDGHASFRLFDADWWRPGWQRSEPVIDSARAAGERADRALWGDHGLVDEISQWLSQRGHANAGSTAPGAPPASGAAPAPGAAPGVPASPRPSPERQHLEVFLTEAESEFSSGLELYRQAMQNPDSHTALGLLRQARQHMLSCKDQLDSTIPAYGRVADHDPVREDEDTAMQNYNQRLLQSVDSHLGLLPSP